MLDWDAANPGIQDWRNRPGFGIPGLQSLVVLFTASQLRARHFLVCFGHLLRLPLVFFKFGSYLY